MTTSSFGRSGWKISSQPTIFFPRSCSIASSRPLKYACSPWLSFSPRSAMNAWIASFSVHGLPVTSSPPMWK